MPTFNFLAIGLAALIPLIVGSFWYMPGVTGNMLKKTETTDPKHASGHPARVYVLTLVLSIPIAMLLSAILSTHDTADITLMHGLFHGAMAAVFLGTPPLIIIALFDNKPTSYILIHTTYWIVSMALMGGLLGYFGM